MDSFSRHVIAKRLPKMTLEDVEGPHLKLGKEATEENTLLLKNGGRMDPNK